MKIKVSFTVDVDPNQWLEEYGIDDDVRRDVQEHAKQMVLSHYDSLGVLTLGRPV